MALLAWGVRSGVQRTPGVRRSAMNPTFRLTQTGKS